MTIERIEKAIEIINYALENKISLRKASLDFGFASTYVKNVKSDVYKKHKKNKLDVDSFNLFNSAYLNYIKQSTFFTENEEIKEDSKEEIDVKYSDDNNLSIIEWNGKIKTTKTIKTLDDLLKEANVDLELWKVNNYTINKWDVTSWKQKKPETIQNWQVKANLIRNNKIFHERKIGELFIDMIKNYEPPILEINNINKDFKENNLLEISIFDLHIGKLAWGGETFENYDTKIARSRFLRAIKQLLARSVGFSYSRILFPIGSDFFNSDTIYNTTTKGTRQDEDLRWQKTFDIGSRLIVDAINFLKQTGVPVDVLVIPGNHDYERSFYLGKFISAWFNNDTQVTVDTHASPRKYYKFGNVLLGFTHGNEEKESSLPLIMASDIPSKQMWSETKYHEWHIGHQHRKKTIKYEINKNNNLNEELGVTIRYLSSLTGTDEWLHKKGYIGQIKGADGFIWNDENGLIAHLNVNIDNK